MKWAIFCYLFIFKQIFKGHMNLNQWGVQFCTARVPTTVVMMVPITFSTLNTFCQLIFISHKIISKEIRLIKGHTEITDSTDLSVPVNREAA